MQSGGPSDDLVVSTPERVAFQYEIAGIGSRFLAQLIDIVAISIIELVITILAISIGALSNAGQVAALIELLLTFALLAGYFLISEAAWNGQTLGKRSMRLRVVGDLGQPLSLAQSAIRNLVRIVDFLPFFYGIGIVAMFLNRRSKRIGDFAAGTLVVRDKERINLYDLSSLAAKTQPALQSPPTSIWSTTRETAATSPSIWAQPSPPEGSGGPASGAAISPPPANQTLDPSLRKLVVAYAARRESLPLQRRDSLARSAEGALRRALPDVVASAGPLAALDILAQREGITPLRPVHRNASAAMAWGMTSLIFCWLVPIGIVTGILSVFFATRGLRAIRSQPDRFQGADKAKTGRLLGWIGLVVSSLIALLIAIGFIFRS
jgi:uncharacterized RDD family membrane protein YckC